MRRALGAGFFVLGVATWAGQVSAVTISFANVANGVWSTGLNASATALAGGSVDPHYFLFPPRTCTGGSVALNCSEDGNASNGFGPSSYVVLGPNGTFPLNGTWALQNDSNSGWIGPRADQTNPTVGGAVFPNVDIFANATEFYVYRLAFNLSALGILPSTADIKLQWLSDNSTNAEIRLCSISSVSDPACASGTALASSGNPGQGSAAFPTAIDINSGFVSGLMALDFIVFNDVASSGQLNPSGLRVQIMSATGSDVIFTPTPTVTTTGTAKSTRTPGRNGELCTDGTQCNSTFCADGVCCNIACKLANESCDVLGREGTCLTSVPAPTMSWFGILASCGLLAAIAALQFRRRNREHVR